MATMGKRSLPNIPLTGTTFNFALSTRRYFVVPTEIALRIYVSKYFIIGTLLHWLRTKTFRGSSSLNQCNKVIGL